MRKRVSPSVRAEVIANKHTGLPEMIRLSVDHISRPPCGLRQLRISFGSWWRTRPGSATVVWVPHLLPRLDVLDECFGDDTAVLLLNVDQGNPIILG